MKIFRLPKDKKLYIHTNVIEVLKSYAQVSINDFEKGGFLAGYQNKITDSIIVDRLTIPFESDLSSRTMFEIKDQNHYYLLSEMEKEKSFYIGNWHTHPSDYAHYSKIDYNNWHESLASDIAASEFYVFIIVARKEIGVWAGSNVTNEIFKIDEYGS